MIEAPVGRAGAPSVPAKTLVVEDEADLCETCVRLLAQLGHTCLTARTGGEAIALIDAEHPSLVVTDLKMPTLHGLAVTRHARRVSPPVPVIVTTGYSSQEAHEAARQAGATVFLPKPFTAAEFVDAVRRALGLPPSRSG